MINLISIKETECLTGTISAVPGLSGKLSCNIELKGALSVPDDYSLYFGDCEVVPKAFETQTIATANKLLRSDILVREIPYFETHNTKGTTVYIAKEV